MDTIELTTTEREALHYWRFHHPPPRVHLKLEALSLQSHGLASADIWRLGAIANPTFSRSLHEYRAGGIATRHEGSFHRRQSPLADYRASIAADWRQRPPARGAEAAVRMAQLTGLERGPTPVRRVFKSLGMQPRQVGQMPAQADVTAQEDVKPEPLDPRVNAAKSGPRLVFFMEAAHCVFAPFVGVVGCFERLFVGRQRLQVLAAWNATTRALFTVQHLTSITSETICELLQRLAGAQPGIPITMVLDNARYQRYALVQSLAQRLGSAWLFWPAYSPNLTLMERFWKCVKKQWLSSKYDADHVAFQHAIIAGIAQASDKHKEEFASLLTLKLQSFKAVQVIGEASNVSWFPVARQRQRKVSCKAA